ncbi:MAG TPA: DUF3078 domain-containing protein [Chitinophagaceae bacterium]|jgi:hypothetical protein|nr:DUF3078 domain-containing protein [Chitinophagaceae bacterium]
MKPTKSTALIAMLLMSATLHAQDKTVGKLKDESSKTIKKDPADTLTKTWKKGGLLGLNLAQTSISNWAAGGDDFSLSLNSLVNLYAFYKKGRSSWDNTLDFSLGYIKTTSLGSRKNDDRIDILSKYGYAISSKWNVSGLFNFRSQLFKGYTYSSTGKTFSSAFLSPAYIILGAGFDFKPNDQFSVFISPATARLTIVKDDSLSAKGLYGVTPGEHHHFEFGAFLSATYLKDLNKIVSYKGRLDLFSNYQHDPQNIDLYMSNIFAVKLSKWLTANWNFDMIYDDDTKLFGKTGKSPALQLKSLVGVGLLIKF